MLPTPIKTPKKRSVPKSALTARALFQDSAINDEMVPSPKKARKAKRYNGFSLESFRAEEDETAGRVQIYTDSCDQVPELDATEQNPFIDVEGTSSKSRRVTGTPKRRRVSGKRSKDAQVEEAIRDDDGMVYVFRGKKVYRRFDDAGEEEEEIDADDIGLLERNADGTIIRKPLKTLTRKGIRPTRLFQTEEQQRTRQQEKDEEADTDVEEEVDIDADEPDRPTSPSFSSRFTRSRRVASPAVEVAADVALVRPKKTSPFDKWPRFKSAATASARASRGRKRAAPDDESSAEATLV